MLPVVKCPKCGIQAELDRVLIAQSNQNVIYRCPSCNYWVKNVHTSKG
ncbi:hypothetical protein CVD19_08205 [Bacillus sp. T33-2]|nr:hypothetical protein CVD19_08205 [Bacillus sp. T33-2]